MKKSSSILIAKILTSEYHITELSSYKPEQIQHLSDDACFYVALNWDRNLEEWDWFLKDRRIPHRTVKLNRKPHISKRPGNYIPKCFAIYTVPRKH